MWNAQISSPEWDEFEGEVDEASVYFVVQVKSNLCFYRIPDNLPPEPKKKQQPGQQFLEPEFILKNQEVNQHGCAAVGSTICVYGGGVFDTRGIQERRFMCDDVYYIDTSGDREEEDWKKGKRMDFVRRGAVSFSINNKIYVHGGIHLIEYNKPLPMMEYDPDIDEWQAIPGSETGIHDFLDSAVYEQGNKVLLKSRNKLLIFDADKKTIEPCTSFDYGSFLSMTVLGHILYLGRYSDDDDDGTLELVGYDLEQRLSPVLVTGLSGVDSRLPKDFEFTSDGYCNYHSFPRFKLITIGENKLAIIWALTSPATDLLWINCHKIEIKKETISTTEMTLTAQSLSFSKHKITGTYVDHYLPVYYSPKEKVDVDTDNPAEV